MFDRPWVEFSEYGKAAACDQASSVIVKDRLLEVLGSFVDL